MMRPVMAEPARGIRTPACLAVPVALAAVLRGVHLGLLAARDPLFAVPVVDSLFHAKEALRILESGWLLPGSAAFYKGPLYSYLLAVLIGLFGPVGGVVAGRVLSAVCGVLAVWLVARAALRFGGPAAAWAAGLALALNGTAIFYDAVLLPVSLTALLLLLAGERLAAARDGDEGLRVRSLALAGALLGLVALTRADGLIAALAAAGWAAWEARRRTWDAPGAARAAALVLVPALAVVLPASARNAFVARDPVLISWNGGINLFMGNDPGFDQASGNWNPDLAWMRLYDAPAELGLRRGADHQRFFVRQALAAATADPATALELLGRKALLWFSGYEIANNQRFEDATRHSPLLAALLVQGRRLALPFGLLAPAIGAGLVLLGRRRAAEAAPWLVLAAAWASTPLLFFNTARFRLPAVVLLLVPAAVGWAGLPRAWRAGERRQIAGAAGLALLLAIVASVTIPAATQLPPSEELNLADHAAEAGRADEALAWRRRAVERDPRDVMARIRLADTLRVQGACSEALEHYARVEERVDAAAEWRIAAMRSSGRCLAALGRYDEAADAYRQALDADPDRPRTAGRPDFHLRGVPPLAACRIRLELADALRRGGQPVAAAAELSAVVADCGEADRLAGRAQAGLRALAGAAGRDGPTGSAPPGDAPADEAGERPR